MTNEIKNIFGKRLKEAYEKAGFTQAQLARAVKPNLTAASISGYVNGNSLPSLTVVHELAKACNVSIDWLCGEDEVKQDINTKTYGDVLHHLSASFDNINILVDINNLSNEFLDTTTEIIFKVNFPCSTSHAFPEYLKDWVSMRLLYFKGAIKKDVYELWINDSINKLSRFEIGNPDDDIPF